MDFVGKQERKRPMGSEDNIKMLIFEKLDDVLCTGFIWLRIGTSGGLL
jgi:hypothetical protein